MPFDFYELKHYDLDYQTIFHDLFANFKGKLFQSDSMTQQYLLTYLSQMKKAEEKFEKFLNKRLNYLDVVKSINLEQVFQQPINFDGYDIHIHFLVDCLIRLSPDRHKHSVDVPIDYFIGQKPKYFWTPQTLLEEVSHDPVIAVPYFYYYNDFLIIDGNHRLTKWTHQRKDIPVVHATADSLIDAEIFAADFDKIFYIFQIDSINLGNIKENYPDLDDQELLESSFLKKGKFGF